MHKKRFRIPLLLIAAGLLLMMIGKISPKAESLEEQGDTEELLQSQQEDSLETRIEQLLCGISGVKDANVVITYADSGEKMVEKDVLTQTDKTHEEDGTGGNRVVESNQQQGETVYIEDGQGNKQPFVKTEVYGTVQGVVVVLKGTYDESIREKIVRALEVLLDVPTHKVQVIW